MDVLNIDTVAVWFTLCRTHMQAQFGGIDVNIARQIRIQSLDMLLEQEPPRAVPNLAAFEPFGLVTRPGCQTLVFAGKLEFGGNSGCKVGDVRDARMGVIQITQPHSTDVRSYGIYDTRTIDKDVSVVMTITFRVE